MLVLKKLWSILSDQDRTDFRKHLSWNLLEPVFNLISLVTLIPFLYLVVNPNALTHNKILILAKEILGFHDPNKFLVFVGCLAFAALIAGNVYSILIARKNTAFVNKTHRSIATRFFKKSLSQDYDYHLKSDPSRSRAIILRFSYTVADQFVGGLIRLASSMLSVILLVTAIIVVSPFIGIVTIVLFGGTYALVYAGVRKKIKYLGQQTILINTELQRITVEPFMAIKDILMLDKSDSFVNEFDRLSTEKGKLDNQLSVMALVPRYSIEILAFGSLLLATVYMLATSGAAGETIPVIGTFAYACQKLAPALRSMFNIVTQMRFNISQVYEICDQLQQHTSTEYKDGMLSPKLTFSDNFQLKDISFRYENQTSNVLEHINLNIAKGTKTAVIGASGRGKSTLIHILAGILKPTNGQLSVDGQDLTDIARRHWRKNIGYVSQETFLFNSTIARNIAFSFYDDNYDKDRVAAAAKIANIHNFINGLDLQYETKVGENGLKISGGQKQRIAIARALYKNPDILILDEATNALDRQTEDELFQNLAIDDPKRTLILISHHMDCTSHFDKVFKLDP